MSQGTGNQELNREQVTNEVVEILSDKDIIKTLNTYKSGTGEKELAAEFVKSYIQFVQEIVAIDNKRGLLRSEVEFRDLVSHVNILMKNKDETTFRAMVFHCPSHYKSVYKSLSAEKKQ